MIGGFTLFPADTFFKLQRGEIDPGVIRRKIGQFNSTSALTVVHIRHHWVLAEFFKAGAWHVYDSAFSNHVRRDIFKIADVLQLQRPTFPPCPQQVRGSNECGLFVLVNALLRRHDVKIPSSTSKVSLASLRASFPSATLLLEHGRIIYGVTPAPPQRWRHNPYASTAAAVCGGGTEFGEKSTMAHTTAIIKRCHELDKAAGAANICFLLCAAALGHLAGTTNISLDVTTLSNLSARFGLRRKGQRQQQMDIGDALPAVGISECFILTPDTDILPVLPLPSHRFVARSAFGFRPYIRISTPSGTGQAVFIAGARFSGSSRGLEHGAMAGHYDMTLVSGEATVAVFEILPALSRPVHENEEDEVIVVGEAPGERAILQQIYGLQVGDNIEVHWRVRGTQDTIVWRGVVTAPWSEQLQCTEVMWERGLQLFGSRRRLCPFPEARIPDPSMEYLRIVASAPAPPPIHQEPPRSGFDNCENQERHSHDQHQHQHQHQYQYEHQHQQQQHQNQRHPPTDELLAEDVMAKNGPGDLSEGGSSPRLWYLYPAKPPHVSAIAWAAITPDVRRAHLRWLRELRSMPADLLHRPLAQAAIELVRRMAAARSWRWSTIARALSNIRGALLALPLYSNESTGTDLSKSPEWRAASITSRRRNNETPPCPPPPINKEQYLAARRILRPDTQHETFLLLMWSFAARAADIGGLNAEDVVIAEGGRIAATVRRGKGAKFRGPYPVAAVATMEDAALLARHMATRRPHERLFFGLPEIRSAVAKALQKALPGAGLPSVRKGAARHLVASDVPEHDVARLTGHTRLDTLRRYLGYAQNLTTEARAAQENTRPLAPGHRRTDVIPSAAAAEPHQQKNVAGGEPQLSQNLACARRTSGERSVVFKELTPESGGRRILGPCT